MHTAPNRGHFLYDSYIHAVRIHISLSLIFIKYVRDFYPPKCVTVYIIHYYSSFGDDQIVSNQIIVKTLMSTLRSLSYTVSLSISVREYSIYTRFKIMSSKFFH